MASRIQPKDATLATTGVACLVGALAWILINSIYVGNSAGWAQFALSVFSAAAVCAVGAFTLGYGAYQQLVLKNSLFADQRYEPAAAADAEFDYRSTGQWAVVTGATDGIGKEYARQLAADFGMDVLLVGRNPDKLRIVAAQIRKESRGSRRVMTVVADFAEDPVARRGGGGGGVPQCGGTGRAEASGRDDDDYDAADRDRDRDWDDVDVDVDVDDRCFCSRPSAATNGRCTKWYPRLRAVVEKRLQRTGGVGVLINCAGVCYPHPEYFAGMRGVGGGGGGGGGPSAAFNADFCDVADASVRCNVAAAVHACRLVLPGMLARGRGLIVNVGSASASVRPAAPLMAVYASTKKFLEKLSADLDTECAYLTREHENGGGGGLGVRVQCVRPAYVATAMLRSANPDVRPASDDDDDDDDGEQSDRDDDGDGDGEQSDRDDDGDGDVCWWTARRKRVEASVQRWMVPSARRWVRSALRRGGQLYASGADDPANFTGYWPHTLLVWCAALASAVMPRRWFVDGLLMPGMLKYRAKGRTTAISTTETKTGVESLD